LEAILGYVARPCINFKKEGRKEGRREGQERGREEILS
jgi:hypothetical protein